jgi:transcriptional regulator with XRE-family HTH domain
MSYKSADLVQTIRNRRAAAGISQRDLGARSGLSQAHISQIESGKLEPGLSSFIDLARALDFEVMLVPKRMLPAVQGLLRETKSKELSPEEGQAALQTINQGERLVKKLRSFYGSSAELDRIVDYLRYLKHVPLRSADVELIADAIQTLKRHEASGQSKDVLTKIGADLQRLRNHYAHGRIEAPRPAYALDDEDADA